MSKKRSKKDKLEFSYPPEYYWPMFYQYTGAYPGNSRDRLGYNFNRRIYAMLILILVVLQFGKNLRPVNNVVQPCCSGCVTEIFNEYGNECNNHQSNNQLIDNSVLFIIVVFLLVLCGGCFGGNNNYTY